MSEVERSAVEGRVLRPGDPSPGRNQGPRRADPPSKQLRMEYVGPMEGQIVRGGTYGAFCLDGPARGKWQVQVPPFRVVLPVDHLVWMPESTKNIIDESITVKTVTYDLHRLALHGSEEVRQYRFWSSRPGWDLEPGDALFLLIDAEPWQTALCRVPDRH